MSWIIEHWDTIHPILGLVVLVGICIFLQREH